MLATRRLVLAALALSACSRETAPTPALLNSAIVTNGGFESSAINASPDSWTVARYLNDNVSPVATTTTNNLGLKVIPPASSDDLNLTADQGVLTTIVVGAATTQSQNDADLGAAGFRYPEFGLRSGVVNSGDTNGKNQNVNSMKQLITLDSSDVDPTDSQIHIRFVAAPVLQNPGHNDWEQPYFFIQLKNITTGKLIYTNFNFAGQTGVPWKSASGGTIQYTDWQLVDIMPGALASLTDQVELTIYAAGCSRGGHWGRVYVDAFGATIPGLFVSGSAPAYAINGTDITYTLVYQNGGATQTTGTQVSFVTPPNTTFRSASAACTTKPAVGGTGTVTCPVGTLAAGASGTLTVTVRIGATFTGTLSQGNYWTQATGVNPLLGARIDTLVTGPPASITAVSGGAQSTTVNTAFTNPLVVVVKDSGGNVVPNQTVTFTVPASGASATLTGTATTDANGKVSLAATANSVAGGPYTVSATVGSVATAATFALTNTPGAPASISVVSGGGQSATVNTAFANPLVVVVKDSFGNVVPGASVTFTPPGSGASATLTGTATTNASGQVSLSATANSVAGGPYTVSASVSGVATAATFALTNTPGAAASIAVVGGGGQSTVVHTAFANPLVVVVKDAFGNVAPGVSVTFTPPGAGASAALTGTSTTNASGQVSLTATANGTAGSYNVTAKITGQPAVSFALTNTPGSAAAIAIVSGTPQSATVHAAFGAPLVVRVTDADGNVVSGVSVAFASPGSGASATLSGATALTDASGLASITATANATAGSYNVTAQIVGPSPVSFALTNVAGSAASIVVVSGTPQSATVHAAFAAPLVAKVADADGNPVSGASVTFTPPGSGARATISGTTTTNAAGLVSVTATANATAGSYTVAATTSGAAGAANFALTNNAGAAANIAVVSGTPQSVAINSAFGAPLVAKVTDADGNPVSSASVTFTPPGSGASAAISGTTTTNGAGLVSVTATANATAGGYNVVASVSGVVGTASFALTNDVGAPASIAVVGGGGQTTVVKTAFAAPLIAVVKDAGGNLVPGATVSFSAPASGAAASFSGSTTTDSNGRVSVVATANATAGSYSARASVAGVATAATWALTNTPGTPASVTVVGGSPQSTPVSTAFPAALVVVVKDADGNVVPNATVMVTAPSTGPSATVTGGLTSDANGRVSLNATANATSGGPYAVTVQVAGVVTPATFQLTNLAGGAAKLVLHGGDAQSTVVATAFANPLSVTVTDANDNPLPDVQVSFGAPATGPSATLSALTAISDAAGHAQVSAIANIRAGSFSVTATVSGVAPVQLTLTNLVGPAASLRLISGGTQTTTVDTAFAAPLLVEVDDAYGNPVPGAHVAWTAPASGPSAALSASDVVANGSGQASISATANGSAGTYLVTASLPGGQQATFTLSNTAKPALAIVAESGTPQSAVVATAFAAPLVVLVTNNGTPVANANVSFLAPTSGPRATLSATSALTDATGHAHVGATAGTVAGSYTVTATVAGASVPASFALTNQPGAPVALSVGSASSPQSAEVNHAFAAPIVVTVTDAFGNPVPGVAITFTPPSSGASAGLDHTSVTTDANGNAVVNATAGATAGGYVVMVAAAGVSATAQVALTNLATAPLTLTIVSGSPQSAVVATAYGAPLRVLVSDGAGQPVSNATVHYAAPASGASAVLAQSSAVTDSNGNAEVAATANHVSGRYDVQATVDNGAAPARFALTNLAGAPVAIGTLASSSPQATRIGTAYPRPLVAVVTDAFGNPVPGVSVTFVAPASEPTATLTAAPPTTDVNGQIAIGAVASQQAGHFVVTATAAGVATPADFDLTNLAGDAGAVSLRSGGTQTTQALSPFAAPLVAHVVDDQGNAIAGATVTATPPASGPSATLIGSLTTDANGDVSLTLTANDQLGSFELALSVAGAATAASGMFTITAIPTTTTLAVTPSPATSADSLTLAASVSAATGTPGGDVRFLVDGQQLGTATLAAGKATLVIDPRAAGSHAFVAQYDGAGPYGASSASPPAVTIGVAKAKDGGSLNGGGGCSTVPGAAEANLGGLAACLLVAFTLLLLRHREDDRAGISRPSQPHPQPPPGFAPPAKVVKPARFTRRPRRRRAALAGLVALASAGAVTLAGRPLHAQSPGAAIDVFTPAVAGSDWFALDSLDFRGRVRPSFGLVVDYAHNPLVHYLDDGSHQVVVAHQLWLDVGASLVFLDRFRIAATLPIAAFQQSNANTLDGVRIDPPGRFGLGDLTLALDIRLFGRYDGPVTVAVGSTLVTPTGSQVDLLGNGSVGAVPRLMVAGGIGWFAYAAQAGIAFRSGRIGSISFHDEVQFAASVGARLAHQKLLVGPEAHGFFDIENSRPVAFELDAGAHYRFDNGILVGLGVGTGVARSLGVPDARALGSIAWTPPFRDKPADRDHDGIADRDDACPDLFGVAARDRRMNGCPADRDGDGIADALDLCPDDAAGATPDPHRRGCPDGDRDGDGVRDSLDACPAVAAGAHPQPGHPGCPDGDRDGDGVFDSADQCPSEPAGATPDPKRAGCPLPDRDGDRIADDADACPDQAGAVDPDPTKNGCPGLVQVKGAQIMILQQVRFATNKDVILDSSFPILQAVANTLEAMPDIKHVSIEGHTDSQGKAAHNRDLSERRANSVMRWLVEHGITAERLEAHGFGPDKPIADNRTTAGRALNRRVEFLITDPAPTTN